MVNKDTGVADLDSEWMQLILEALELGIEKKEIRDFLNSRSTEAIVPVVLEN
ncbi:anti-repressor SinI family protein [Mesobacillus zeae]|uniref:DNA-binding anti-repressor SinI n=1 Tax=Mesobacillus zeae TaxID=1917180 RepID=A0A398B8K8_9BACI|nr:anti-repressor SinI family protein [Mesobacillus zeae]RID85168.1 DNA-binding anti-repressor SinI [Mesobacillus zeae]